MVCRDVRSRCGERGETLLIGLAGLIRVEALFRDEGLQHDQCRRAQFSDREHVEANAPIH
jgi:hypothetical protein